MITSSNIDSILQHYFVTQYIIDEPERGHLYTPSHAHVKVLATPPPDRDKNRK